MTTELGIDGPDFYINDEITSPNSEAEGLLMNSRMVQALFDDECPETRRLWAYPDTGEWDPDRNTDEFCAALPLYRKHGLLAVTVGLQGGGSVYTPEVYDNYTASAYEPDGTFKPAWFDRLGRILDAADEAGMVVIVNYFYWKHAARLESDQVVRDITEGVTQWLLDTGHRNIIVDVANEAASWWTTEACTPENIPDLIDIVQQTSLDGRSLPAGASTGGGKQIPTSRWLATEDVTMPHGNGLQPHELARKLERIKEQDEYRRRVRPLLVNEDSVFAENMRAAVAEGASWGFYCQGYGSDYQDRMNWKEHGREDRYEDLSGFQTLPVNWGINTERKRSFFRAVADVTNTPPGGEL
jgi:hypothetical protein